MNEQPWPERCEFCRFWQDARFLQTDMNGQCRIHAPAVYHEQVLEIAVKGRTKETDILHMVTHERQFPTMPANGWCGEWQALPDASS